MVNILGRIEAVDPSRSNYQKKRFGPVMLESFYIDEGVVGDIPLFRLHEKPTLIVISDELKEHLAGKKLPGLLMRPIVKYNGSISGSAFMRD